MAGTRNFRSGALGALVALLLLPLLAKPGNAQKERQGIFRDLIDNLTPDTPEQMENEAIATRDASEALHLYGSLLARHPDTPEGVRAAIWIGLFSYGAGDMKTALDYFERARKHAKSPELKSRVEFWCEAARLQAGAEPLPEGSGQGRANSWELLRELVRVDRSVRAGRPREAEEQLLSLEGDGRRAGFLGLIAARWGSLLAMNGAGRAGPESLRPLELATAGLPEGVYLQKAAATPAPAAAPASEESWSVQFGAFLEEENAKEQREQLEGKGCKARIDEEEEEGRHWYRVRLGELPRRAAAESLAVEAAEPSGIPYQIVRIR